MGDSKESNANTEQDAFITEVKIKKVRHLENLQIPLSKAERKHLILTGKNGSGKTSTLLALVKILAYFDPRMLPDDIRHTYPGVSAGELENYQVLMEREVFDGSTALEFNSLSRIIEESQKGRFILATFGAKRSPKMKPINGLKKIDLQERYLLGESPGENFIQYMVNLKAEKSFARDDNDLKTAKQIDDWFESFENCLKNIFEDPALTLEFDRKNFNYKILQTGKEPFDFDTLADGYAAIIDIITDLILRMEKHKQKSYDVQGVVLIDEIEAHLHIDLQKKILPFLTSFFPGIQFIVTTHSPFVLNSIGNAVIYDLEKQLRVKDLSAYSYDGIVEGYFDNDKYSREAKDKIKLYEELVNKTGLTGEEEMQMMELRTYLNEIPASLAPGLKARFQQIELARKTRTKTT